MSLAAIEGQKGVLRTLVYLYDNGESNFQKIADSPGLYDRIVRNSLSILNEQGLIRQRIDNSSYPPKNMLSLTEKGKRVAEKLKEIDDIIGG